MGWSRGSLLMEVIINSINKSSISEYEKIKFYESIIPTFESFDCDTLGECCSDAIFAKVLYLRDFMDIVNDQADSKIALAVAHEMFEDRFNSQNYYDPYDAQEDAELFLERYKENTK